MLYFKWLLKRLIFFRRIMIELYNQIIYEKQSQFILHPTNAHRCPCEAVLFYSLLGRFFFGFKEILSLVSNNKLFKKSISLDGFDKSIDYKSLYKKGDNSYLYPKSPMIQTDNIKIEDTFYEKISRSYFLAHQEEESSRGLTQEWSSISKLYQNIFFSDKTIIRENIENFRGDPKIYNQIFTNNFIYISKEESYNKNYMNAIDLVLDYHKQATRMESLFLASLSESTAGNHLCVNYRGKRLSKELLYHAVVSHDIITHVPNLSKGEREIILDIGAGFGGVARILSFYRENTTQILLDLPETLLLTAYYLKDNFPNKKIALLEDIYPNLDNLDEIIRDYDFILIPPFVLNYLKDKSVDLVMNTTSLGFMSKDYLDYYLKETSRVLKDGGYFYSLNSTKSIDGGVGSYDWDYKKEYLTIAYGFDNRFAYPQWLGKKYKT